MMDYFIGIDLGGTNIKAVVVDREGTLIFKKQAPTMATLGIDHVIQQIAKLIIECSKYKSHIKGAGVTVPGVLNLQDGMVELMPNFPHQWKGVRLKEKLEHATSLPIYLLNDARAAAFGEKKFGSGRPYEHFVCMVIGTGVGGGIVSNGVLLMGSRGVAGEIGHQVVDPKGPECGCGNAGCLETMASGPAISAEAIRYIKQGIPTKMRDLVNGDLNQVTPEIVNEAAEHGDRSAITILENTAATICRAILNVIAILNPEAIILGGGVGQSDFLINKITDQLHHKKILFPASLGSVQIVKAHFNHLAGSIGAAAWTMDNLTREQKELTIN
ncbi:ROK family protein [Fictibacillus terranigra]|uniref:ROK family protein n=1 Tax=Fictibacillus terranigra TaxID=3058424 RepID=A0ABT8EDM7_9BACL|nr:ROK family protein [Fictibacillus sp. CENA-BCM004]MDN4076019.1 ROK family protein [Fictibacillus sp. CENA-BCM004]